MMSPREQASESVPFDIQESFQFLEQESKHRFSELFYQTMFKRYPELEAKFKGVIILHQGALLMAALGIIAQSQKEMRPNVVEYLKVLGHRHYQRGISSDDYTKFHTSLLETLKTFLDSKWSEELNAQWQTAIQKAIDLMLLGHREGNVLY